MVLRLRTHNGGAAAEVSRTTTTCVFRTYEHSHLRRGDHVAEVALELRLELIPRQRASAIVVQKVEHLASGDGLERERRVLLLE